MASKRKKKADADDAQGPSLFDQAEAAVPPVKAGVKPADEPAREKIRHALDINLLVEASAGTGKTTSLVERMTNLIRTDTAKIGHIAAVTFTKKAAGELRERFKHKLVDAAKTATGVEQERLQRAAAEVELCFIGTIHSFCARILRERPVEARVPVDFTEIEDEEDRELRSEAWEETLDHLYGDDQQRAVLDNFEKLGISPRVLKDAFLRFADYPDVDDWPLPQLEMKDMEAVLKKAGAEVALRRYAEHAGTLYNLPPVDNGHLIEMAKFFKRATQQVQWDKISDVFKLLEIFEKDPDNKQASWPEAKPADRKARSIQEMDKWVEVQNIVLTCLTPWRELRYQHIIPLLKQARERYDQLRVRANVLNFQDLLIKAARLLRKNPSIREYFRARFTHLLVDEFQDTDPVQAELMLLLTAQDPRETNWHRCVPVAGSLFVVGDPKQSIYRFRRADIVTYNAVKKIIRDTRGQVVELTTSFRSTPVLVKFINERFAAGAEPLGFAAADAVAEQLYSPTYPPMQAVVQAAEPVISDPALAPNFLPGLAVEALVVQANAADKGALGPLVADESGKIARTIRDWMRAGIRIPRRDGSLKPLAYDDFLIVGYGKKHLGEYASALRRYGIPCELSGGQALSQSMELRLLIDAMRAAIRPDDPVAQVALLRGGLAGISDPELYEHRKAHGEFTLDRGKAAPGILGDAYRRIEQYRKGFQELSPAAALERIAHEEGLLAHAAVEGGEMRAGLVVKAIELVRERQTREWDLERLLAFLEEQADESLRNPPDGWPEGGEPKPRVRIMNLHKSKGLEAPFLFLVGPSNPQDRAPDLYIRRPEQDSAQKMSTEGYLCIQEPNGENAKKTVALPARWAEELAPEEKKFQEAERKRLMYVALTRAGLKAVILRRLKADGIDKRNHWHDFDRDGQLPVLAAPLPGDPEPPSVAAVSVLDPATAQAELEARWKLIRQPTYIEVASKELSATRSPSPPGTSHKFTPAEDAANYGSAIHRLLEVGMKSKTPLDDKTWLLRAGEILEDEEVSGERVSDAIRDVKMVLGSEIWTRAQRSSEKFTEIPFTLLEPAKSDSAIPVLVRGVIDLVFKEGGEWVIVDYKTGVINPEIEQRFVREYSAQVRDYARYWKELSGQKIREAGLLMIPSGTYRKIEGLE